MDEKLVNQILENMGRMETDKLLEIWEANDREEYSEEAFEAVRRLLENRAIKLPHQKNFKTGANTNPSSHSSPAFLKNFFSVKKLSIGWSCLWRGLLVCGVIGLLIEAVDRLSIEIPGFTFSRFLFARLLFLFLVIVVFSWAGKKAVEKHFMIKVSTYDCKNVPLIIWLAGIIYVVIPEMFSGRYQDTVGILLAVMLPVPLTFAVGNIIEMIAKKHHAVNLLNK